MKVLHELLKWSTVYFKREYLATGSEISNILAYGNLSNKNLK